MTNRSDDGDGDGDGNADDHDAAVDQVGHTHNFACEPTGGWGRLDGWRLASRALRGGRFHSGDLGLLDGDGNLFLRGRRSDLILRGGANVYPAEVERVLLEDPRVAACAVVGVPDERLGERVVAFVQLQATATVTATGAAGTSEELRARCAAGLARYKVPEEFRFVDDFPRNAMGKIVKAALRALR
jgi:acyl-CoA synthetase (AMP-forming)/AMP-acid ligase II